MRLALLLAALVSVPAFADDVNIGKINASTTSTTNAQASTPFPGATPYELALGATYVIQCPSAYYYRTVSTSTGTVTASNGKKVAGDGVAEFVVKENRLFVAVLLAAGTGDCLVDRVVK